MALAVVGWGMVEGVVMAMDWVVVVTEAVITEAVVAAVVEGVVEAAVVVVGIPSAAQLIDNRVSRQNQWDLSSSNTNRSGTGGRCAILIRINSTTSMVARCTLAHVSTTVSTITTHPMIWIVLHIVQSLCGTAIDIFIWNTPWRLALLERSDALIVEDGSLRALYSV